MRLELTPEQQTARDQFRAFATEFIAPRAATFDREEALPLDIIQAVGAQGWLGALVPRAYGGNEMGAITCGLLHEEVGAACGSVRSLLTVHGMVAHTLARWGSAALKEWWLPRMATGAVIGAFCLTEPQAGSDANAIEMQAVLQGDTYLLSGTKKWVTFGQIADVLLVFARTAGQPVAFLVERQTPGLTTIPVHGLLGLRGSMTAELRFRDCQVPKAQVLGKIGFGYDAVLSSALDHGRYTVAWGCVGLIRACLEATLAYSKTRKQFGVYLKEHQLIQQLVTQMVTALQAARLLGYQAGYSKEVGSPNSVMETFIAKYFASTAAMQSASHAVQVHGALGCSGEYPVQRYFRDAKIMEIIEGSTQIQQIAIATYASRTSY